MKEIEFNFVVIIGAGGTGMSCLKFLANKTNRLIIMDENLSSKSINQINAQYPKVECIWTFDQELIEECDKIVISPGISLEHAALSKVRTSNKIISDIELFALNIKKTIIAITGTNGKSSVVTMIGEILQRAKINVAIGGNLGKPALDLVDDDIDIYVLEISSFQLETTFSLAPDTACILNISPDHLDRHGSMANYISIKNKILQSAKHVVINRDDDISSLYENKEVSFGLSNASGQSTGITIFEGEKWLMLGKDRVINTSDLNVYGKHNWSNMLAAIAICNLYNISIDVMHETLKRFNGLPHRCQKVKTSDNISWFNDSKSTNVGATIASINGFASSSTSIILILGGKAKGQSFKELEPLINKHVKKLILMGEDASIIASQLPAISLVYAQNLDMAIDIAKQDSSHGDIVLFSPGCASFDMFDNYIHRGLSFTTKVLNLQ